MAKINAVWALHALHLQYAVSAGRLRRVIDVMWEAEGDARPRSKPGKYVDLDYAARASQRR